MSNPDIRRRNLRRLENRIPPPLVCLLIGAAMWASTRAATTWEVVDAVRAGIAGTILVFGLAVAGLGLAAFRKAGTTIDPVSIDSASVLVTGGIYRFTRNPMYVGFTALLTAWAVYLAVPAAAIGPVTFALFTTRLQIIPEERAMRSRFGPAYDEYRSRVRRWL
jgi:protein-S-isoprenylcysteine O-methyltransferase Ste14